MPFTRDQLAALIKGPNELAEGVQARQKEAADLAQLQEQQRLQRKTQDQTTQAALDLKDKLEAGGQGRSYNVSMSPQGGTSFGEKEQDPLAAWLKMQQLKDLNQQRDDKHLQDLSDRAIKANTAQTVPALQRGEDAIPGVFSRPDAPVELKSVGGMKNLAPNWSVPLLEKTGIMPAGASKERTALQELSNMKIYDSSGKQINESEMKRIQDAMGLRGVFGAEEILPALRQAGYTAFEKQQQVTAGSNPKALAEFKKRGGLAGYGSLQDLIKAPTGMPVNATSGAQVDENPDELVPVTSPDGRPQKVPKKNLEKALQRGYKPR